ncbi:hypothetical protein Glove_460g36 [Diversispora epigaea]|uniref:Uncharacterized protein n=1 Tax=Diversispora epigaea TaxID=1348612 RepID=A0A397GT20_9GLOM|nr:hypothetical protein Glove_460g36 [Diversispora epigaea]
MEDMIISVTVKRTKKILIKVNCSEYPSKRTYLHTYDDIDLLEMECLNWSVHETNFNEIKRKSVNITSSSHIPMSVMGTEVAIGLKIKWVFDQQIKSQK